MPPKKEEKARDETPGAASSSAMIEPARKKKKKESKDKKEKPNKPKWDERARWQRLVQEHGLNRWQLLVMRIQAHKRWLEKARLRSYSEKGCPRDLDGKATDIGSHLGRWQWREIAYQW